MRHAAPGRRRVWPLRAVATPAGMLAGVALAVVVCGWLVHSTWVAALSERALREDRRCGAEAAPGCLEEAPGTLLGPRNIRRSVNEEWTLQSTGAGSRSFEVGPGTSDALTAGPQRVTALLFREDVVAVETAGRTLRTLEGGTRTAVFLGCWASLALAAGVGLTIQMVRKRRAGASWWRADGPVAGPSPALAVVIVLGFGPMWAVVAMLFGASWPVGLGLGVALVLGLAGSAAWMHAGSERSR